MPTSPLGERGGWLLLAVGEDRQHGGNDGYENRPDSHYSWDSTVPNHEALQPGDAIALWDKKRLLGVSAIEDIDINSEDKLLRRCSNPECKMAGIKARKIKSPRYKCYKCKHEFDSPGTRIEHVTTYKSRHDAGWTDLEDVLSGAELRALCLSPESQLSLRRLRWTDFEGALSAKLGQDVVDRFSRRLPSDGGRFGGHVLATVRVRTGQRSFRNQLLASQGHVCAFTGNAPPSVLEACHLYSYAALGVHHEHGGLLLRRDIHRLFDDGALAVDPRDLRIAVGRSLRAFPQYSQLHKKKLESPLKPTQVEWLAKHWQQHRA